MDYSDYCRLSSSDEEDQHEQQHHHHHHHHQQQHQQEQDQQGDQPADMTELMSGQASAGRHGALPANGELPFYALPRAKKTSAEIIHEARAALGDGRAVVRTVDTSRPFTPRDRQRTLFGTAQSSPTSARPTSAFSMNSLSLSFDANDSRPVSGVRLLPLATGRCPTGKNGSPRQEPAESVTFPALSDASSKGSYHLPALTAHERLMRRQFRAASLDKLPEEGEEIIAALSTRNAHSGPRERTRHIADCTPRPGGHGHPLPELGHHPRSAESKPLSVQRQIVEALRPPERSSRPPPPTSGHLLQLVLSQPEDAGDLHLSDLESSQRMTSGASSAAPSSNASDAATPADSEAEAESADDFGWSLFRKKKGIPPTTQPKPGRGADRKPSKRHGGAAAVSSTTNSSTAPTLPTTNLSGSNSGGGDAMARLHPDAAPRRVVRRGRSSSPRAHEELLEVTEYAESRPGSAVSGTMEEEERPRSQEQQILALLARLTEMADSGASNDDVLTAVAELYQLLADTKHLGRGSQHRIATLKTIFRFVDRQHPRLLVHISRTILALQVSGKNLTSVCKLVFKVAQDDENDALFLEGNFLELLLEIVGRSSPLDDGEACVYSYGALKFLTMNPVLVARLMNIGILDLVVLHLKLITTKKLESKRVSEQTGHALYQLTGVLRNLANVESTLPRLVSSGATAQISTVLALFSADMDVISNVARILSIISTHDDCCQQLVEKDLSFRACIKVLKKYPGANNIVVRMGYALGNLMARSESARVKFFREPEALETLLNLLDLYSRRTASSSNNNNSSNSTTNTAQTESGEAGDSAANDPGALSGTPEDVIVKLIRVVANMVINQEVGSEVSSSPACLKVLLGVLRTHSVEEHEELVLSSLSMLNNLTFYANEESVVFERQTEVTHCLCSMLRKEHTECQIEVLRVFGNLTRWPGVREALADREEVSGDAPVVSRLVALLDSDNRELVYTTVGVLINLMTDPGKRHDFNSFGGIDKLILVLEDFGYSDWQLAALVCKVLWNLTADTDDAGQVFSEQQADQLAIVLDEYLDDEVLFPESGLTSEEQQIAAMLRPLWEEFADVAASLLEKLDDSLESAAAAANAAVPSESTKTA